MDHIGVGVACDGVERGAPSTNVTKICRPPRSCMAPDVDHVTAYT